MYKTTTTNPPPDNDDTSHQTSQTPQQTSLDIPQPTEVIPNQTSLGELPKRAPANIKTMRRKLYTILDNLKTNIYNTDDKHTLATLTSTLESAEELLNKKLNKVNGLTIRPTSPKKSEKKLLSQKLKKVNEIDFHIRGGQGRTGMAHTSKFRGRSF